MPLRESFIRRKIELAENARLSGGREPGEESQGSGPPNRHGMPKLPPGQQEVTQWPVLDLGIQPEIPKAQWVLAVTGEVGNPVVLDWKAFMGLPQVSDVSDFHCVTTWSRMDNHWEGVRFKTLAGLAEILPTATHVFVTGYDGYSTNLEVEEAMDDDVLLVHRWEGRDIPREHGGPVRMIVPKKYAWKGSKWIKEIAFLPQDRKGYWEQRGYSNTAEPWYEDRYSG